MDNDIHEEGKVAQVMYNEKDEKASLDVETYDLYDPLEAVVRKEGLLVSKVLPEDG